MDHSQHSELIIQSLILFAVVQQSKRQQHKDFHLTLSKIIPGYNERFLFQPFREIDGKKQLIFGKFTNERTLMLEGTAISIQKIW